MANFDEIRSSLKFKYYISGDNSYLRATYTEIGYEHSIIIPLSDDTVKTINQRIHESLLAMQAYQVENPEDNSPAEIAKSNPSKATKESNSESIVVKTKTPQQLEKEDEEEADRLAGN